MDRRDFMKLLAAGSAGELGSLAASAPASAGVVPPKIVVVGGGMAGATVAKFLCFWGKKFNIPQTVSIIDQNPAYNSCILSNAVLTGEKADLTTLTFAYDKLKNNYGVDTSLLGNKVTKIDTDTQTIFYANAQTTGSVGYEILILATGVEFLYDKITIERTTADYTDANIYDALPHAWKAGAQTLLLRDQLKAMPDGGKVIITIPPSPYRCPPGPYERACVIADWMKKNRPKSRVVVLDANDGITAEVKNFTKAFNVIHKGYIEYHQNARLVQASDNFGATVTVAGKNAKTVRVVEKNTTYTGGVEVKNAYTGAVLNLIPPHAVPAIVRDALGPLNGLDASGYWVPVDELRYRAKLTKPDPVNAGGLLPVKNIYVLGDGIKSAQPKAGHIANQEAKICADSILRAQLANNDDDVFATPVTNSACFTPITNPSPYGTAPAATWLSALYRYDATTGAMKMTSAKPYEPILADGTAAGPTGDNWDNMNKWFYALMQDVFS